MSTILLISGSPSLTSKSAGLLKLAALRLAEEQIETTLVSVRDFPAEDLVFGKYDSPAFETFKKQVEAARALVISTPVYKAAYTGALKSLLDILPQTAFRGKVVLPIATGGSPSHLLAIDYSIKPLFSALGATEQFQGVYVVDKEVGLGGDGLPILSGELQERFHAAVDALAAQIKADLALEV